MTSSAPGASDPLVIGFDVAELGEGCIRRVHGFLDKVPTAAWFTVRPRPRPGE